MTLPYPSLLRSIVTRLPAVTPFLSTRARLLAGVKADITDINMTYHDAITSALINYMEGGPIAPSRNQFKQAMIQAFGDAFDAGWIEGGGELPIDDDAIAWVEERLNQEASYIDGLFAEAKELRKDKEFDFFSWISAKADSYTNTLRELHNVAKMMGSKRTMLTWRLGNTEVHCSTCASLNGKRHRASWFISHDYIPGKPGCSLECQGYNCDCRLETDEGEIVTI